MLASEAAVRPLLGHERPRIAPPVPARSDAREFAQVASEIGLELYPWQTYAARYLTAKDRAGAWLFPEVAIIVARQNGKSTLLVPLIVQRLRAGHRIMHAAQNRALPLEVFEQVAEIMARDLTLFPTRPNGRQQLPKFGSGAEGITLNNGGSYRIVAATRGGARGPSNDTVIVDELREFDSFDFVAAAAPTLTKSPWPQMVYLSNAGTDDSVVLNALRDRAAEDPSLAYLEWSADPERATDDRIGWAQSNPTLGHDPAILSTLERRHRTATFEHTLADFETEHLCRWVNTLRQTLVLVKLWEDCKAPAPLPAAARPFMAVSVDPAGTRASAAIAWQTPEGYGLRLIQDVVDSPVDIDRLGKALKESARKLGVVATGFDPLTDAQLARHLLRKEPIAGGKFANASALFASVVDAGRLRWEDSEIVGEDLAWTAKKPHDESGSFQAVRADDDRPITASLAAIRALWMAAAPRPDPTNRPPAAMGF